jgi:hypothetical protein
MPTTAAAAPVCEPGDAPCADPVDETQVASPGSLTTASASLDEIVSRIARPVGVVCPRLLWNQGDRSGTRIARRASGQTLWFRRPGKRSTSQDPAGGKIVWVPSPPPRLHPTAPRATAYPSIAGQHSTDRPNRRERQLNRPFSRASPVLSIAQSNRSRAGKTKFPSSISVHNCAFIHQSGRCCSSERL